MERVKGIEPSYAAWEAAVLPLNYTRTGQPIDFTIATGLARLRLPACAYDSTPIRVKLMRAQLSLFSSIFSICSESTCAPSSMCTVPSS